MTNVVTSPARPAKTVIPNYEYGSVKLQFF